MGAFGGWIAGTPRSDPDSRLQNCHSRSVFTSAKPQPRLESRRASFSSLPSPCGRSSVTLGLNTEHNAPGEGEPAPLGLMWKGTTPPLSPNLILDGAWSKLL